MARINQALCDAIQDSRNAREFRNAITGGDFEAIENYFAEVSHNPVWDLIPFVGRHTGNLISFLPLSDASDHTPGQTKTSETVTISSQAPAMVTTYYRFDLPRMGEPYDRELLDYVTRVSVDGLEYAILNKLFGTNSSIWSDGVTGHPEQPGGVLVGGSTALAALLDGLDFEIAKRIFGVDDIINLNIVSAPIDKAAIISRGAIVRTGESTPAVYVSAFNTDGSPKNERTVITELTHAFLYDPKGIGYFTA